MKKAAIVYDFDKTLCTKDMQEYSLIPSLGYENAGEFWDEVTEISARSSMDGISAYLYLLQKKYAEQGRPLTKESFRALGKDIVLYPGVDSWFKRVNAYARKAGFYLEHYIISSGMQEIIDSVPIRDEFARIYACRYFYDDNGNAIWPAQVINYTTKTQYIFRINKQVLDVTDDAGLNEYVEHRDRPVPFERMIYIADGITDIPCMKLVKEYGGKSIAVYNSASDKAYDTACKLIRDGRANFMAAADYREGSKMESLVFRIFDHMKADASLQEDEGKYDNR
ncbi:MAG: haloacid dehalogenase-like hydrolase [Solobacterium sp.]|nr:haloacid dehalogenase-like hydrolase [Solobacterium sp.]